MKDALNFSQQSGVFDPALARPVTVIGIGSVGSKVVLELAKLGCEDISVWDDDDVVSHNISGSAYRQEFDIGKPKVAALAEMVQQAAGLAITTRRERYAGQPLRGTVVSCVDSMTSREAIWSVVRNNPFVDLFVDTRLAVEYIEVYAIRPCTPEDVDYYAKLLYPSSEAFLPNCGFHGAPYVSSIAAATAVGGIAAWWRDGQTRRNLGALCGPFQEIG